MFKAKWLFVFPSRGRFIEAIKALLLPFKLKHVNTELHYHFQQLWYPRWKQWKRLLLSQKKKIILKRTVGPFIKSVYAIFFHSTYFIFETFCLVQGNFSSFYVSYFWNILFGTRKFYFYLKINFRLTKNCFYLNENLFIKNYDIILKN